MSNKLEVRDIINSIEQIEKDCEQVNRHGENPEPDYKKFYERVSGLMLLSKEVDNKKGGAIIA